jgi:hypothetical protein
VRTDAARWPTSTRPDLTASTPSVCHIPHICSDRRGTGHAPRPPAAARSRWRAWGWRRPSDHPGLPRRAPATCARASRLLPPDPGAASTRCRSAHRSAADRTPGRLTTSTGRSTRN